MSTRPDLADLASLRDRLADLERALSTARADLAERDRELHDQTALSAQLRDDVSRRDARIAELTRTYEARIAELQRACEALRADKHRIVELEERARQALRERDEARAARETAQSEARAVAALQLEDAATIDELRRSLDVAATEAQHLRDSLRRAELELLRLGAKPPERR
jgi:chromosome segregation ATPase